MSKYDTKIKILPGKYKPKSIKKKNKKNHREFKCASNGTEILVLKKKKLLVTWCCSDGHDVFRTLRLPFVICRA